jgi:hypothetical protein
MFHRKKRSLGLALLFVICSFGCSSSEAQKNTNTSPGAVASSSPTPGSAKTGAGADVRPVATPAANFTAADVAKLKWIEGTWRGMDGDKPFYERYKLENTALVVASLKEDGSADGAPERFELKNGEFGKGEGDNRSAASEITDNYIQFVAAAIKAPNGQRNSFRFQRESDINWTAILEWPASAEKPARQKIYKMERWEPTK